MNEQNNNNQSIFLNYRNNETFKENQEYKIENGIMNLKKLHTKGARKIKDKTEKNILSKSVLKRFVS
jgi:hypothetical protein